MKKLKILSAAALLLCFFSAANLFADEFDIDSLFDETTDELYQDDVTTDTQETASEAEKESEKDPDLLNEVLKQTDFTLTSTNTMTAGFSPGIDSESEDFFSSADAEYSQSAVFSLTSKLSLDVQISPVFRAYQAMSISWPDFEYTVSELFGDYTLADTVYFRMGIQKASWGISSNFPFTDIIARVPDDFDTDDDYDTALLALKMNIPIGIGGLEAIAFTRNGYIEDTSTPAMDELGAGAKFNIANELLDLDFGLLYHDQLNLRSFYSLKATLFDFLEVYQEGLVTYDPDYEELTDEELAELMEEDEDYKVDNQTDLSANAGFYFDLFDSDLKINGEYFFNGEESELEVLGTTFPLYYGHNIALNLSYDFSDDFGTLYFQGKYNVNEESGYLVPAARIKPASDLQLYFGLPIVLGPSDGGYYTDNPDSADRRLSFVAMARLTGKKTVTF